MMVAIFAALLVAFAAGWYGRERLAALCVVATFVLAFGLFLYEIYSPEYGFRMPWIQTLDQSPRIPPATPAG